MKLFGIFRRPKETKFELLLREEMPVDLKRAVEISKKPAEEWSAFDNGMMNFLKTKYPFGKKETVHDIPERFKLEYTSLREKLNAVLYFPAINTNIRATVPEAHRYL